MKPSAGFLHEIARRQFDAVRDDVLIALPDGRKTGHRDGYVPLLIDFTREDGAARGLRRAAGADAARPPERLTALEAVQQSDATLLVAPAGYGKTTFARNLVFHLAGERLGEPSSAAAGLTVAVPRFDGGPAEPQEWTLGAAWPILVEATAPTGFLDLIDTAWRGGRSAITSAWPSSEETLLVIVDAAERLGTAAEAFLAEASRLADAASGVRVVVLADEDGAAHWRVPASVSRHRLVPVDTSVFLGFIDPKRATSLPGSRTSHAVPAGQAALALELGDAGGTNSADLTDRWLTTHVRDTAQGAEVVRSAYKVIRSGRAWRDCAADIPEFLGQLLAARHFAGMDPSEAAASFETSSIPLRAVASLALQRLAAEPGRLAAMVDILSALPGDSGLRGALLAADHACSLSPALRLRIRARLADATAQGLLTPLERIRAGACLSVLGDPRDLAALVTVPAGSFWMGSAAHPNSRPVFRTSSAAFRIGRNPVSCGLYAEFCADTARPWNTERGRNADRANAPAVDLNWYDARAFCGWATVRWRRSGRISPTDSVRLPTEPEWERAARGDLTGHGEIYPWGPEWLDDRANAESVGHNDTCAVGLFPAGASPWGCLDMAGQVWEWTSTLWAGKCTCPSFGTPIAPMTGGRTEMRRPMSGGSCVAAVSPPAAKGRTAPTAGVSSRREPGAATASASWLLKEDDRTFRPCCTRCPRSHPPGGALLSRFARNDNAVPGMGLAAALPQPGWTAVASLPVLNPGCRGRRVMPVCPPGATAPTLAGCRLIETRSGPVLRIGSFWESCSGLHSVPLHALPS